MGSVKAGLIASCINYVKIKKKIRRTNNETIPVLIRCLDLYFRGHTNLFFGDRTAGEKRLHGGLYFD